MHPEERTDAAPVGARGHVRRDLEVSVAVPHTGLVCREDREVFRLDLVDVAFVSDAERAAARVLDVVRVEGDGGRAWAGVVA